jgi:hypothetical protein
MLRIAKNLELPLEAVTQTFAILAKRGVGKTYTASVMVEEMLKNNLPVVVLDPIGVWWGLRSSADGKGPGLPIIIAGGDHSDIPITPDNGTIMANMIVDQRLSVVIDFSHFRKGEQIKFVTDFAETLYHRNRDPLHLVVDEADAFAPQRIHAERGPDAWCHGGPGPPRPSSWHWCHHDHAAAGRAQQERADSDRGADRAAHDCAAGPKAIDEWVKTHAEADQRDSLWLPCPPCRSALPGFGRPAGWTSFKKVDVRTRETLDSSSTPKVGDKRIEPT